MANSEANGGTYLRLPEATCKIDLNPITSVRIITA